MRKNNQKGFTIIELLVVIVIIGILVALALPQLFAAQARGRDTERKNDLKNIQTQLETYFNDNGAYVATSGDAATVLAGVDGLELTADDLTGPRDNDVYTYTTADSGQTYTLSTTLENDNDPDATNGAYSIDSVNQATAAPVTP